MARLAQKITIVVILIVVVFAVRIIWLLVREEEYGVASETGRTIPIAYSPMGNAIRVENLCRENRFKKQIQPIQEQDLQHFLINKNSGLAYCFAPLIASTFWKKTMYLLNEDKLGQGSKSLVEQFRDLSTHHIHTTSGLPWLLHAFTNLSEANNFLSFGHNIMFVCSPYRRLFATYVSKFLLPAFWQYAGTSVVKRVRSNPSEKSKRCGYDVTFSEFIEYVVNAHGISDLSIAASVKDHWEPISATCQPCRFRFQEIGKIENFYKDIKFISKKLNIANFDLSNFIYKDLTMAIIRQHIRDSIEMATSIIHQPSPCLKEKQILDRLWKSFQLRGIVRSRESFLFSSLDGSDQLSRLRAFELLSLEKASEMEREEGEKQQITSMVTAYSLVSNNLLNRIKSVFHEDFILFGYEKEPIEIYGALSSLHQT